MTKDCTTKEILMNKKLKIPQKMWNDVEYTENPDLPDVKYLKPVVDFLPPPEQLVLREPTTEKITLTLDSNTIDFFKTQAKKLNAPYQRMIRNLLREYAERVGGGVD